MSRDDYYYKRKAISIAKQLFYPKEVIAQIQNSTNANEISRIMKTARMATME